MKTKYFSVGFILLLSMIVFSCGKNFLDEPPRTVTIEDLLNNPQDGAQRLTAAVYNKLYDWDVHTFSWIGISSITSDDADKGSIDGDAGTDKVLLDSWTFDANSFSFNEAWSGNFDGIGRVAYALQFMADINLPQPEKDRYIGELKMLRAYFYWNLVRMYGGVPKIDRVLETKEDIALGSVRASAAEIYAFIEADCLEAIAKLPPVIPSEELGRVSKYTAYALLAKVYLYQKRWAESKAMCDAIINSNKFFLLADYDKIWRETGEFSTESIWEVNAIGDGTTTKRNSAIYFCTGYQATGLGF